MPEIPTPAQLSLSVAQVRRDKLAGARGKARALFESGTPGLQIATTLCLRINEIVCEIWKDVVAAVSQANPAAHLERHALLAVGGTGRGDICPYSDLDLVFLAQDDSRPFRLAIEQMVTACYDAKLHVGQRVGTTAQMIELALADPKTLTSLIESRLLWGSTNLFDRFTQSFRKTVVDRRKRAFIEDCLTARSAALTQHGPMPLELEPDVKGSVGGLRDFHLLRWLGFAQYGTPDLDALRLRGGISPEVTRQVLAAWDFLTRVRLDLHFHAGKSQDHLNRDEQLRIAETWHYPETPEQLPVERFMQDYLRHSSGLATVVRRFALLHRSQSFVSRAKRFLIGHAADGLYRVTSEFLSIVPRRLNQVCQNVESMLKMYQACARYDVLPSPETEDAITAKSRQLLETLDGRSGENAATAPPGTWPPGPAFAISPSEAQLFLDLLKHTKPLGGLLRSLFETRLLDLVVPDVAHIRCLLQFNQYHSFTVDEHTLRTIEAVTSFENDQGPLGVAYRAIEHKEVLHLALLLHDAGKGYGESHSPVGARIAERIGRRFGLPNELREQLVFLVLQHLDMAHLAFRRNYAEADVLVPFSVLVNSPESLRMLYVLTAADVMSVGPTVWNDWKAGLLAGLFELTLELLTGSPFEFVEQERLAQVRRELFELAGTPGPIADELIRAATAEFNPAPPFSAESPALRDWLVQKLDDLPPHHLAAIPPAQILSDIATVANLQPNQIQIDGHFDRITLTMQYRIVLRDPPAVDGCFHKIAGVLTALRLEILSADICTTRQGVVIDRFRVRDHDYDGPVPPIRMETVAERLRSVLTGEATVQSVFQRHRRFGGIASVPAARKTRVEVNRISDARLIIDVYAHDRPGLLYTIAKGLYQLNLSVDLARIATHFDQVVDVFYVTDGSSTAPSPERITAIREPLLAQLTEFESSGFQEFLN